MKSKRGPLTPALLIACLGLSILANPVAEAAPKKLKLLWSDEFNGNK